MITTKKSLEMLHSQLELAMASFIPNETWISEIKSNLLKVYKQEEEYWKQISRQLWLTLGDANT